MRTEYSIILHNKILKNHYFIRNTQLINVIENYPQFIITSQAQNAQK